MTRSVTKNIIKYFLFFVMVMCLSVAYAQQDFRLNENFENVSFSDFVNAIESKSSFQFYYDPLTLDSILVKHSFNDDSLKDGLSKIFEESRFHFLIRGNHVFITYDIQIRDVIPDAYIVRLDDDAEKDDDEHHSFDLALLNFLENGENQGEGNRSQVYEVGKPTNVIQSGTSTISGKISNVYTGEPIIGALVHHESSNSGVSSDVLGNYRITIPTGRIQLKVSSIGMLDKQLELLVFSDGELNIELREEVTALKEVVIEAKKGANIVETQMGVEKIDIKTMSNLPTLLGEVDVLKVLKTLPGVQSSGENSTGLNVRGGSTGQNLILFNDAPIYNPSHLFGFFSVFNPEVVKDLELYKSGIPAQYGGRLSSVLTVNSKDGNKKKFGGSGGIGLVAGRILLEGPIIKDKFSFLVSGRSTYSNWLLSRVQNENINNSDASYYDLHTKLVFEKDEKNSLTLSSYFSKDKFSFQDDTTYRYNNFNTTLKWKKIFNEELYSEFVAGYSSYQYNISFDGVPLYAFNADYKIGQVSAKADFSYYKNKHSFSFGINAEHYHLSPVNLVPYGNESIVESDLIPDEQALETALYIGDQIAISDRLSVYGALRFSFYQFLGPGNVNVYAPGVPKDENAIIGKETYGKNEVIKSYQGPELRASARYMIDVNTSFKLSYHRMRQYIHQLSNTTTISPTDIWKLSDSHILPEIGDQVSLGFYRNLKSNTIETSLEVYYKTMDNFLDYKDGAQIFLNRNIETDIIGTTGKAYGAEIMLKKVTGKFNGWLSYTYSRSLLKTEATIGNESINQGKEYPSAYDRPHDVTLVSNYKISRRFNIAFNFTYSTGRPTTLPLGKYDLYQAERLHFSERNQYRIPDYYRADIAINFEGNHKIKKLAHSSWSIAVYNVTGRDNAYSVFYRSENGIVQGYQLSIFSQPIPTITYNFRF